MSGQSVHPFPSSLGPYIQMHLSRWQVSPGPHVVAQQWSGHRPPLMHIQPYVVVPFILVLEQKPFFLNRSRSSKVAMDQRQITSTCVKLDNPDANLSGKAEY